MVFCSDLKSGMDILTWPDAAERLCFSETTEDKVIAGVVLAKVVKEGYVKTVRENHPDLFYLETDNGTVRYDQVGLFFIKNDRYEKPPGCIMRSLARVKSIVSKKRYNDVIIMGSEYFDYCIPM